MEEGNKKEGYCSKVQTKCFKVMLFGKFIALLLIIMIMWFIYSY
jgi:hypothetical protein